mmetsp:Transcript_20914/g.29969  ORF Transcript_20914/g.29969 Transcript_20914/m.29969 type:complete len:124 (+) Transcript_20914:276-647(+)
MEDVKKTLEALAEQTRNQNRIIVRLQRQYEAQRRMNLRLRRQDAGIIGELELVITELRRNRQPGVAPYRRARGEQMLEPPDWLNLATGDQGSLEEKHIENAEDMMPVAEEQEEEDDDDEEVML